jgi:hypothetical protein
VGTGVHGVDVQAAEDLLAVSQDTFVQLNGLVVTARVPEGAGQVQLGRQRPGIERAQGHHVLGDGPLVQRDGLIEPARLLVDATEERPGLQVVRTIGTGARTRGLLLIGQDAFQQAGGLVQAQQVLVSAGQRHALGQHLRVVRAEGREVGEDLLVPGSGLGEAARHRVLVGEVAPAGEVALAGEVMLAGDVVLGHTSCHPGRLVPAGPGWSRLTGSLQRWPGTVFIAGVSTLDRWAASGPGLPGRSAWDPQLPCRRSVDLGGRHGGITVAGSARSG